MKGIDPRDAADGVGAPRIAARLHAAVAAATARACTIVAERDGLATVVLSGGVFQNRLLLDATGQAAVAAARTSG